jgi:putative endonuclease
MPAWVYLLRLRSGAIYTGSTRDVVKRLTEHFGGIGCRTTINDPPVALAYIEEYPTYVKATLREAQVNRWTRAKKEALIRGDMITSLYLGYLHYEATVPFPSHFGYLFYKAIRASSAN